MRTAERKTNNSDTNRKSNAKGMTSGRKAAVIMAAAIVIVGVSSGCFFYLQKYSKGDSKAQSALIDNADVVVTEFDTYYLFEPYEMASDAVINYTENVLFDSEETEKVTDQEQLEGPGVIFYPAEQVEETAYAPLARELVEIGYSVFVMKMPMHWPVFDTDAGEIPMEKHPEVTSWTMMGHSLGGTAAADFTRKHSDEIQQLVLLGAYSETDLTDTDVRVLTIYGSEDQVLNWKKYERNRSNLPDGYVEYEIAGGNHSYFGNYIEYSAGFFLGMLGLPKEDGSATITPKEQQQEVIDQMLYFGGDMQM